MVNLKKLTVLGIVALLVMVLGMVFIGCDSDNGGNSSGTNNSDSGGNNGDSGGSSGRAPSMPTGVYASTASSSSISVTWSSVSSASGYTVYHSTSSSGTYSYRGASTSTSYTDTGLSSSTTYYYKVSAYNSYGESAKSTDYDYATTSSGSNGGTSGSTPSVPSSVYASAVSSSSISVSWSSVSGASGCQIPPAKPGACFCEPLKAVNFCAA